MKVKGFVRSRMRESRTYGSVRGGYRKVSVYSINKKHAKTPFGCKSFDTFLSEDYSRIEYIIFLSPDEAEYDGLFMRRP